MNDSEVLLKLQNIINKIINKELIIDGTVILKDIKEDKISLGLSSLDMMDLIIQVEMEFEIEIEPERYIDLYDVNSLVQIIIELSNNKKDSEIELKLIQKDVFG